MQGNVHMIVGAGANIAVQVGEDGVLVVDTGEAGTSDKVLAAIKQIAPGKEIRWVINTGMTAESHRRQRGDFEGRPHGQRQHRGDRGAREHVSAHGQGRRRRTPRARSTPTSRRRAISPSTASRSCSITTTRRRDDTGTMVMFRRSDVIAAGDVFRTEGYPVIDLANGGSIDGTIAGLNRLLDLTVPSKMLEEGGHLRDPGSRTHQRRARRRDVPRHARDHPRSDPQTWSRRR